MVVDYLVNKYRIHWDNQEHHTNTNYVSELFSK